MLISIGVLRLQRDLREKNDFVAGIRGMGARIS